MRLRIEYLKEEGGIGLIKPDTFLGPSQFDSFRSLMKCLGLTFNKVARAYPLPKERIKDVLIELKDRPSVDVVLDPSLIRAAKDYKQQQIRRIKEARGRVDKTNRRKGIRLRPYQEESIELLSPKKGAILAEPMGLGKTVMALIAIPEDHKVIVVCPSIAKGVWAREIKMWRPGIKDVDVINKRHKRYTVKAHVTIVSGDSIPENMKLSKKHKYTLVIDEAQMFKNAKAQRTSRIRGLARRVYNGDGNVWPLTGTPVMNREKELWAMLVLCQQHAKFGKDFEEFAVRYFNATRGEFNAWVFGSPTVECIQKLKGIIIRHNKREVLPDLPAKQYRTIGIEIDAKLRKLMDAYVDEHGLSNILSELEKGVTFSGYSKMAKALAAAKIPAMVELVEEYEEAEEPLIVASAHLPPIDALRKRDGWAVIDGSLTAKQKTQVEDDFQAGMYKGVALSIKAGGVAITLTRASHMLIVDPEPVPGLNAQVEDRICRIGQHKPCMYTTIQSNHELDEGLYQTLLCKSFIINRITEGVEI